MSVEFSQLIEECLKGKQEAEQLTLPKLPKIVNSDAVKITFEPPGSDEAVNEIDLLTRYPVMESDYTQAELVELNLLNGSDPNEVTRSSSDEPIDDTAGKSEEKRNIYEAWLEFETTKKLEFNPGDSIGISIGNYDAEVDELIGLLGLSEKKEHLLNIENRSTLSLPSRSTLRLLIKYCLEIRAIPKKVAILHFSEFCSDANERDCLLFLSSKEGSKLYDEYVLKRHFGFLDLLKCFSSCKPNLRAFLVHSISFVPRYYSVIEHEMRFVQSNDKPSDVSANGPVDEKSTADEKSTVDETVDEKSNEQKLVRYRVKLAFNVTLLPTVYNRSGTQSFGIFTGQMDQHFRSRGSSDDHQADQSADLNGMMDRLSIGDRLPSLYVFKRKNTMFRLSYDPVNIIMLSIGTGITPFLSLLKANSKHNRLASANGKQAIRPNYYLVHGCRTEQDCLYLDELKSFAEEKFFEQFKVCCSREDRPGNLPHVQDFLKSIKNELKTLLLDRQDVVVYVCGDQIKFPKDMFNTLVEILDQPNGEQMLREMQKNGKYLQDVWL